MNRRNFSLSMLATAALAGCGGGGESGDGSAAAPAAAPAPAPAPAPVPGAPPELASATTLPAATVFAQTVAATDGGSSVAPGQANFFDLDTGFTVSDGYDDQFDDALNLSIDIAGTTYGFPWNQGYAELTALGPEMGAADGVQSVSFTTEPDWVLGGTTSAVLHPGPDARLQQTLDLTSAAGHAVNLTWTGWENAIGSSFNDEPFYQQVVVRDNAGNLLGTLFRADNTGVSGTWGSASLSAYAGQTIVLSFEHRLARNVTVIDDVSVLDVVTNMQFVNNGDFEAGAAGWTVPAPLVAQNVRSGARTLGGVVTVQRTFFTQPNALWGRMTDVFTNTGPDPIQVAVNYLTNLGSDGDGVIYATPGANGKALTTWDGSGSDRDVGLVYGADANVTFQSASNVGMSDGNDEIGVGYIVDILAGASVTIANFVILTGDDTGSSAADASARATTVDTLAADIANNFRTNVAYQRGLTQDQLDTLKNF